MDTLPIKSEPESPDKDGRGIPSTEIDKDLPDVNIECLEESGNITQTASKTDYHFSHSIVIILCFMHFIYWLYLQSFQN